MSCGAAPAGHMHGAAARCRTAVGHAHGATASRSAVLLQDTRMAPPLAALPYCFCSLSNTRPDAN